MNEARGVPTPDEAGLATARARYALFAWAALAGVLAALVFAGFPAIDVTVSRAFFNPDGGFVMKQPGVGPFLRGFFTVLTWSAIAAALIGAGLAISGRRLMSLGPASWVFVLLTLVLGPGLVANTLFKDQWGRPRPLHIAEFGGPKPFVPVLTHSTECARNCSFVSGEASSVFALLFAVALLARRRQAVLFGLAILGGATAGIVRIAQGGHFLSDVVFAGVFMALVVALVHWIVFDAVSWPDLFHRLRVKLRRA